MKTLCGTGAVSLLALAACGSDRVGPTGPRDGGQGQDGDQPGWDGPPGAERKPCTPGTTAGSFPDEEFRHPVVQCHWSAEDVVMTPIVADLNKDGSPEIIFAARLYSGPPGYSRIYAIRGSDCAEVWKTGPIAEGLQDLAAGDLDGDGKIEVVALDKDRRAMVIGHDGTVLATTSAKVGRRASPVIANVDGSGPPEFYVGGSMLRFDPGPPAGISVLWSRNIDADSGDRLPLLADLDGDGVMEVLFGYEAEIVDGLTGTVKARLEQGGLAAVADLVASNPGPEIVVVGHNADGTKGRVAVLAAGGALLKGPFDLSGPYGGAPTVADYDGDGRPEIGVAARYAYQVFDLDCDMDPAPAGCAARGLLWSSEIKSNAGVTGSTVFDFNPGVPGAKKKSEAVARDVCFLRVYEGATGKVLSAITATSISLWEIPTVADVDGDGSAEIVVPVYHNPGFYEPCGATDPHSGAPFTGYIRGVLVLRDPRDCWAPARPIWNQHSYHVTNVEPGGAIPLKEKNSWEGPNTYRQNVAP